MASCKTYFEQGFVFISLLQGCLKKIYGELQLSIACKTEQHLSLSPTIIVGGRKLESSLKAFTAQSAFLGCTEF